MSVNHKIKPEYDLTLAVLEGITVEAFCGDTFVPTVIPGTSGRFTDPIGRDCEACEESFNITVEWNRLRREKNRLVREMRAVEKAYRTARKEWREERENAPKREEVTA